MLWLTRFRLYLFGYTSEHNHRPISSVNRVWQCPVYVRMSSSAQTKPPCPTTNCTFFGRLCRNATLWHQHDQRVNKATVPSRMANKPWQMAVPNPKPFPAKLSQTPKSISMYARVNSQCIGFNITAKHLVHSRRAIFRFHLIWLSQPCNTFNSPNTHSEYNRIGSVVGEQ